MLPSKTGVGAVVQRALDCNEVVDEALQFIIFAMVSTIYTLEENSQLYSLKHEELSDWLDVKSVSWKPECFYE